MTRVLVIEHGTDGEQMIEHSVSNERERGVVVDRVAGGLREPGPSTVPAASAGR